MPKLPTASGREVIRALHSVGFEVARIAGSHHILKKPAHVYVVTVPVHGGKPLKAGTLRRIVKDAGLTMEEFVAAINR